MKPGNGGQTALRQEEMAALEKVVLHSFNVSPLEVPVGGSVTATWNTTVPALADGFRIVIFLEGQPVTASGSKAITVNFSHSITLTAAVNIETDISKVLGQHAVTVDTSQCQTLSIPASLITGMVQSQAASMFSGSSQFSVKPQGISVTAAPGALNINVPLNIDVPDFFDAAMTIAIQIAIAGPPLSVSAPVVDPEVSWGLAGNLLSLGCTEAVSDGMTQISRVFLQQIVANEVLPQIKSGIADQISTFTKGLQQSDPQKRIFTVHTLTFSADGLTVVACPQ